MSGVFSRLVGQDAVEADLVAAAWAARGDSAHNPLGTGATGGLGTPLEIVDGVFTGRFAGATGEILFFTDVRQPLNREALAELVANLADQDVGAVSGELRLHKPEVGEQADLDLYWRYEVWVRERHTAIG